MSSSRCSLYATWTCWNARAAETASEALAGQQVHGTVSALGEQFGLSRPMLYQVRDAASELLYSHFGTVDFDRPTRRRLVE
ncbi:MAG: hypothetical protein HOI95_28820 [Chromatiales bacterium]|jgi:hypothetical protein|nr:hypothetical protein [Chromatiales bacterium]